ncbi:ATP-binding protein [Nonomuraea sp. NEAU-A123]|uniref:ATP-binding protein n=1 Tax=Nonomuraea sp. NEAU-A123 TaxID=2839649 RepID=UPI001BE43C49|nr:ATP-binding protein [Nonomuraea sp. NEAU-A123]MBT2233325.1 ATP-binding protein [Nonomuraea sp. NEAU-A123]
MQPSVSLSGPWYRIQSIAAPSRSSSAEWDFVTVLPAVLSAAQRDRPFVIGWLSRGSGAPLELITNAGPLSPPRQPRRATDAPGVPAGPQPLLFPGGARGVQLDEEYLADLADLVWTPCPGRQAPPLGGRREFGGLEPDELKRPTLFEATLVTLMSRPFAWLVVAEPTDLLDAEVAHLRTQLNVLRQYGDASERSRFDAERAERRMQELDAFREAGLWNVRVLAGGATAEELRQIAPVLVGSVEMSHHPYRLRSAQGAVYGLSEALGLTMQDPADGAAAPFAATAGALAALAGLPRREVPGVRVLDSGFFDVTSEAEEGELDLGEILDGQDRCVGSFRVPLSTLNRHAFVTGATGSGKSQTVRHLLEQLSRAGIPWLAIEPAKSEYAAMAGRLEPLGTHEPGAAQSVTVINPSAPAGVPFSINPLEPEPGYPVQAHIDMVRALFMAAFDAEEPFPQIMSLALQRVYEATGWDVVTGGAVPGSKVPPSVPTLELLQQHAMDVIKEIGYGREVQADVEGFISLRLRSLRVGSAGRFFEGGHPADIGGLLERNVVLAIEDVANDEDKAFLMGTLIIRIVEHLRMRARQEKSTGLRHVIVIEEAHRLLRDRGTGRASTHAVELLAGMLAEIRAYGEGIVVAEQIPTKLVTDVVKNTALKVVHRLPAEDDRQLVGAAMNLSEEQSRHVVSLQPGSAAVFADGMDRPLRVRVPLGESRERLLAGPPPPIRGRRSAACGSQCRTGQACTLVELREADVLADAPDWAWLRIWCDTVVLAFVSNRPLPGVPRVLAAAWSDLPARRRECLLATLIERSVQRRAWSLRTWFDPVLLTEKAAETATRLLAAVESGGERPGASWVIPQVRWLHEVDRLFPYGQPAPNLRSPAPPMEYALFRNASNGGSAELLHSELLGHRAKALRHHPLSMEVDHNRALAWRVILGDDENEGVQRDITTVAIGVDPSARLRHVGQTMGAGWLEGVLSWPRRFVLPFDRDGAPELSFAEPS